MSLSVEAIRERSRKRKKLLAQQLGVGTVENLREVLRSREGTTEPSQLSPSVQHHHNNQGQIDSLIPSRTIASIESKPGSSSIGGGDRKTTLSVLQGPSSLTNEDIGDGSGSGIPQLYTDSSTFLKGTQSSNPHNDYCQHFVDTGQRPQNFIRDTGLSDRFEEYPKLKELIRLKDDLIQETASPPMYLKTDLSHFHLGSLPVKFDVILIEPPLEEYQRTRGVTSGGDVNFWGWDQIMSLDIPSVAAPRSFLFLWCGSSEGLDMGRICLRRWGFRRCEDICWIRTNSSNPGQSKNLESKAVFQRTKEHCLMGIKGTVRRSTDGDFIHANVDIDLIITEEEEYGSMEKPTEIFNIIEHFCLGRRRLHLFGRDSTIRPGWLTIGPQLTNDNFNADTYASYFAQGSITTGCTERIESLRPKSPPPKAGNRSFRGRPR